MRSTRQHDGVEMVAGHDGIEGRDVAFLCLNEAP